MTSSHEQESTHRGRKFSSPGGHLKGKADEGNDRETRRCADNHAVDSLAKDAVVLPGDLRQRDREPGRQLISATNTNY
jgi:hypothetical protein